MPRQVRTRPSVASRAPRTVAGTRRRGNRPTGELASQSSASASTSTAALADSGAMLMEVRQLRSRQVPLSALGTNASARPVSIAAAPVRGKRRRSCSTTSSSASESTTCDVVNPATAGAEPKRSSPPGVQTRFSTRAQTSSSMSVASCSSGQRRQTGAVGHGCEQLPTFQAARADRLRRDTPSGSVCPKAQRKPQAAKAAQQKQEMQPAEQVTVSCVGCQVKMLSSELESHQSRCCLQFPCPLACHDNCQWGGNISQAVDHILKNHRSVNSFTGPTSVITMKSWRKSAPIQWVTLQTCLGQNFLIVIQKIDKNKCPFFLGTVKLFGYQEDADRFEFRMVLKTRGKIARRFSYSTIVQALHDENAAINNGDCFTFDTSHAEIFSFEGNLEVEVSISVMKM